jgi:hypothetical protein
MPHRVLACRVLACRVLACRALACRALACRALACRALACRVSRLLAACCVLLGALAALAPGAAASTGQPAAGMGWLRMANLSPGKPTFDIYLYPVGNSRATLMLRDAGYGMISRYRSVPAGSYTVALRRAGHPAGSEPVVSSTVSVTAGRAYTLASLGPSSAPRVELLNDTLAVPKGKSLVRIIQASLRQSRVTVTAAPHVLVHGLAFGSVTSYAAVPPGPWKLRVTGPSESGTDSQHWRAGTSYTVVVLDGAGHLELDCLTDGAGSKVAPAGGAAMGLGGMARPVSSSRPWLAGLAAGVLLIAVGALWLRRTRATA